MTRHQSSLPTLLLLLLILAFSATIYVYGPFTYPWLEDDDSWGHAAGIKYIAVEKTLRAPSGEFPYLNPYPPLYDLVFAVLHQFHPSLYWTMKFYNGVIICLGVLAFFFFARRFMGGDTKALWATFFLAVIPCYLSHFIWAHALAVSLFFPAFFCLHRSIDERRFLLPAALVSTMIFLTQPTQSVKFVIMVLLMALASGVVHRRVPWRIFAALALAGLLSLVWWGPVLRDALYGRSRLAVRVGQDIIGARRDTLDVTRSLFSPDGGTATRPYTFKDYVFATEDTMVNNPVGVGWGLCLLAAAGFLIAAVRMGRAPPGGRIFILTTFFWWVFTFLGTNSMTFHLPVGLFAFRFWMLFAIPTCLFAAVGADAVVRMFGSPIRRTLAGALIFCVVMMSSGVYKVRINLGPWSYGQYWQSDGQILGYLWMRRYLPKNTWVFAFTDNMLVIGHDMAAEFWRPAYKAAFGRAFGLDVEELHRRLRAQGYAYLIIETRDVKRFGLDAVNSKFQALLESGLFKRVLNIPGAFKLYRVL